MTKSQRSLQWLTRKITENRRNTLKNIGMAQRVQLCTHKIQDSDKEHEILENSNRFHNNLYWNQVRMKVCLDLLDSYIHYQSVFILINANFAI